MKKVVLSLLIGASALTANLVSAATLTSAIAGKTFYANTDCGIAKNWPNAGEMYGEGKDCLVTLAVDKEGAFVYTAADQTFNGFAEDVTLKNGTPAEGLFFSNLQGSYIPVTVSTDGNTLVDTFNVLTLTTAKPAPSALAGLTFTNTADCAIANNWYKNDGQAYPLTGKTCNISLAFDANGNYVYTTDTESHKGSYQQRGQELHLSWDTLATGAYYVLAIDSKVTTLTLTMTDGSMLQLNLKTK